jgi:hypothetical protein
MFNTTLMVHPSAFPFKIAAIHTYPQFHYIFGTEVTDHGDDIFTRRAVTLSRNMAYAETNIHVADKKDVSRPVAIDPTSPTCVLCASGTPHTTKVHNVLTIPTPCVDRV